MSNIAFSIDWLKCTFAWDGQADPLTVVGLPTTTRTEKPGTGSYNSGLACDNFSVYWHTEHPEWRIMLQLTGTDLSNYRNDGWSEYELLELCVKNSGRFTRVDFAVDVFDTGGKPADFVNCWHCDQVSTVAQSVLMMERATREDSRGQTVYIGSGSSERMVRVYEKGKHQKLPLDWLRIELEAKGKRAVQLGEMIVKHNVKKAGLRMLGDVIDWTDIPWFEDVFGDEYEVFDIDKIGRPETKRDKWLRTVVVPVVEDELEKGNVWLLEALTALIVAHEDSTHHGPNLTPHPGT